MKRVYLLAGLAWLCLPALYAQIGIGTTVPSSNSILDLTSANKGLLIPRMTASNRPANTAGMVVYQTDGTSGLYLNNGSAYSRILGGTGTSNYVPKFNSSGDLQNSLVFDNGTGIGIGITNPSYRLDISGGAVNASAGFYENGTKITNGSYWTLSGNHLFNNNSGYVGVGTTAPAAQLDVSFTATSHPVPRTLRVTSDWNPTTVTALYTAYGFENSTTGTLANSQGTNTGNFYSLWTHHTTTGSSAGNMAMQSTRGLFVDISWASNAQDVNQHGAHIVSTLDHASGNIITNTGLLVVTGNTLTSSNPQSDKGVINNNYGIRITRPDNTGTIYQNYGLHIGNMDGVGQTLNYPIFYNAPVGDAYLTSGGVWTNASDSSGKENIIPVNTADLLEKINRLPLSYWNYKCEKPEHRHVSPMAQDFYSIFNIGYGDNTITTIDPSGVALAGIQELAKKNQALQQTVENQARDLENLRAEYARMLERLGALERQAGR